MAVITFRYNLPLDQSMPFEGVYHKNQQLDLAEKQQIRDAAGSIFVWMFLDDKLVGETYGTPLESSIPGLTELSVTEDKPAIHCYSNTILPDFQRRGLGKILKAHWLGLAVATGYEVVYGHARPGPSQTLNASFGAVFIGRFPDWYGSGEEYQMYRLTLK